MVTQSRTYGVLTWCFSAAVAAAATIALFLLMPLMNRGSDGAFEKSQVRKVTWVSPRQAAPAPPPRAPRPPPRIRNPKPSPPKPPSPRQPSVRNAPPAARPAPPALPLRVDASGFLTASAGGVTLYAPPESPEAAQENAPVKQVKPEEKPYYLPHETDTLPAPVKRVLPEYPRSAWKDGVEGYAVVRFTVDRSGRVKDMRIEEWKGSRDFSAAATKALSQWSFTPGKLGGKPVAVVMRQRFVFSE